MKIDSEELLKEIDEFRQILAGAANRTTYSPFSEEYVAHMKAYPAGVKRVFDGVIELIEGQILKEKGGNPYGESVPAKLKRLRQRRGI